MECQWIELDTQISAQSQEEDGRVSPRVSHATDISPEFSRQLQQCHLENILIKSNDRSFLVIV